VDGVPGRTGSADGSGAGATPPADTAAAGAGEAVAILCSTGRAWLAAFGADPLPARAAARAGATSGSRRIETVWSGGAAPRARTPRACPDLTSTPEGGAVAMPSDVGADATAESGAGASTVAGAASGCGSGTA